MVLFFLILKKTATMEQRIKILLVDDEKDIVEFLAYNLSKENYDVFKAYDGQQALTLAQQHKPHLIILDIMMPGMDGIEVCAELRKIPEVKEAIIVFLTARNEDYTQVAALETGADDFIAKPIKPRVFITKIKSLLRRLKPDTSDEGNQMIEVANLKIDPVAYVVYKEDEKLVLPRKEFELLRLLASQPNKVFTREEILTRVWGEDIVVGERTIDVHIRKIREKLQIPNIQTIKGIGYKFEV